MAPFRRVLDLLGASLLGLAALLGQAALEHMRSLQALGYICGGGSAHCAACPAALAAALLGVAVLWLTRLPVAPAAVARLRV